MKLKALSEEDLPMLSSVLQDALCPVMDMTFLAERGEFVLLVNRFVWEREDQDLRCHALVRVPGVERVRTQGFHRRQSTRILELLTIDWDGEALRLILAEGVLELTVSRLAVSVEDTDEPWPATGRPRHGLKDS